MPAKSQSPKRSESPNAKKGKKPSPEDILLESKVVAATVETPKELFGVLAFAVSLLPVYVAAFPLEVPLTVVHLGLFAFVVAGATFMLQKAYDILFYAEFMKRDVPHPEVKTQEDANLLRATRLELSMARTLFQINVIFLGVTSALQLYVFKKIDPRASLLMAPTLAALTSWFVAYKTEETRKKAIEAALNA